MEILLLMMLAGLTAGVGLWAARGRKEGEAPAPFSDLERRTGPKSSPGLPGTPGEAPAEGERGRAVVLGSKEGTDRLRETLDKAPSSVQGRVVPGGAGRPRSEKPKKSDRPLKLTYNTDQIIARSSRYAHHRRALANAESLAEKRKGDQALEIFDHTKNRIPDEE
ncbi:MAG: hypothetical protein HY042_10160, partial [Spirochaetia bacterium]|nr:hypothetical protein [Spirochaetia bacterium]